METNQIKRNTKETKQNCLKHILGSSFLNCRLIQTQHNILEMNISVSKIYIHQLYKRNRNVIKKGNKRRTRQTVKRTERKEVGVRKNGRGKGKTKKIKDSQPEEFGRAQEQQLWKNLKIIPIETPVNTNTQQDDFYIWQMFSSKAVLMHFRYCIHFIS